MKKMGILIKQYGLLLLTIVCLWRYSSVIYHFHFPITDFSQTVVSMASAKGIDMSKAVLHYMIYAVPLSFFFAWQIQKMKSFHIVAGRLSRFSFPIKEEKGFFFLLLISLLLVGKRNWVTNIVFADIILASIWIYLRQWCICWENVLVTWILSLLSAIYPIFALGAFLGTKCTEILFGIFSFFTLLFFCSRGMQEDQYEKIKTLLYPFLVAAGTEACLLLLLEIILVRNHTVNILLLLLPTITAIVFAVRKKQRITTKGRKVYYLACLLLAFTALPALGRTGDLDFFEGANHGVSISEAILGTGIPIIDNLDAHLLWNTIGGLLYYVFTGDYVGALLAPPIPLFSRLISIFCLAAILKNYISKKKIFLILAFFPWQIMGSMLPGLAGILLFQYWLKRKKIVSDAVIACAFVVFCFLRIDIGSSFGLALLISPILYSISIKDKKSICRYCLTCILIFVAVFLSMDILAKHAGKDIFLLLNQFVTTFASNQHWSFGDLGEGISSHIFYFVLPIIFAVLMLPHIQTIINRNGQDKNWIIVYLYMTFLFAVPRFLGRHTLIEHSAAAYTIPLFLLAFLLFHVYKKGYANILLLIAIVFVTILSNRSQKPQTYLSDIGTNILPAIQSVQAEKRSYWQLSEEDKMQIDAEQTFFDEELSPGETYFDFSNQSLFFAFTKRKNPIYINQSPAMVNSSKKGQLQMLSELQKNNPRFVVMPYQQRKGRVYGLSRTCDGILNEDRYYLFTEYIAKYYRPYCFAGNFAIWCKKEDYDSLVQKDKENNITEQYLSYDYEQKENLEKHNLGQIPYLWGNYASEADMFGEKVEMPLSMNTGVLQGNDIFARPCFLLLSVDAETTSKAEISFAGAPVMPMNYVFDLHKGKHLYRIRVSSDWHWYAPELSYLKLIFHADNATLEKLMVQKVEK